MVSRSISLRLQRLAHRNLVLQVALVFIFWIAGQTFVKVIGLPIPGSVVGMLLVLLMLATRRMSVFSIQRGAEWFIADLMLFFVPAVLAVLDHRELFGLLGLKILTVILGGTIAVVAITGLIVDLCWRWNNATAIVE